MSDTSLIVNYGDRAQLRVEFRLNRANPSQVMGRYLPGVDGIGRTGPWELRQVDDSSDEAHVRILEALREVLAQFTFGDAIEEPTEDLKSRGRQEVR